MQSSMSGANVADQVDELPRDAVARVVPRRAVGSVYGAYCPNTLIRCRPFGRGRRVVAGLEVHLAVADVGAAGRQSSNACLRGVEPVGHRDHRRDTATSRRRRPGTVGRRVSAALNFTTGLRTCHVLEAATGTRPAPRPGAPSIVSARFGSALQTTVRRSDQLAALQADALARDDLGHLDAAGQHRAGLHRGLGDGEADHPHPALDVAPHRALPAEVALVVHQLDRRRAPVARAGVRADHALAVQRVLQALIVDVVVEHLGDRRVEQDVDHPLVVAEHRLELVARGRLADPGCRGRGCAGAGASRRRPARRPSSPRCRARERPSASRLACVFASSFHCANDVAVGERRPEVRIGHEDLEPAAARGRARRSRPGRAGRRRTRTG